MRRIFQFTALVALLLWVPATVHCGLESMFGWAAAQESCCDHEEGTANPGEHCAVEDGAYRVGSTTILIAAPDISADWCSAVVCTPPGPNPDAPLLARSESPPELARTWQFAERTALPGRPPSRVS